jgi:hypothetical protein
MDYLTPKTRALQSFKMSESTPPGKWHHIPEDPILQYQVGSTLRKHEGTSFFLGMTEIQNTFCQRRKYNTSTIFIFSYTLSFLFPFFLRIKVHVKLSLSMP